MAVRQINTANYDYAMMLESINKSYKGMNQITISAYNTNAAPDVKVGSVWEDNGAIFILETADLTPTGYAGMTNSTTFYLYYDDSASVFIYLNTVPTWSDALQGWYNGNDRALFSMYKDSGGTLYQSKQLLKKQGELYTKVIEIGDWDMDADSGKSVTHGLDYTKIRNIVAVVRSDSGNTYDILGAGVISDADGTAPGGITGFTSTVISLARVTGKKFDSATYDLTSYNRGWITLQYGM